MWCDPRLATNSLHNNVEMAGSTILKKPSGVVAIKPTTGPAQAGAVGSGAREAYETAVTTFLQWGRQHSVKIHDGE